MAKVRDKKTKPGRNDSCWCSSGKKYKDCHYMIEQTQRAEQLRLRQAQDTLLPKLIAVAQSVPEMFPAAFERFWQGKYAPEQMSMLDDLEDRGAERFLTWFVFDYVADESQTLVEKLAYLADHGGFEVDEFENRLLHAWRPVRMRPYVVAEVRKGQGLVVRDLLEAQAYEVADNAAARRMAINEIMVGHLVPGGGKGMITPAEGIEPAYGRDIDETPVYFIAGAMAQLTGDTAEKLVEFAGLHLEDLRRSHPGATWSDLLRQRSYVLNHFVMELPRETGDLAPLDNLILQTRTALQLTGASLSGLVGKHNRADTAEDDRMAE